MALEVKLGQDLRLRQQLVMTPQLQQAIKMLQLSNIELADFVEAEIEQNPLLEHGEPSGDEAPIAETDPVVAEVNGASVVPAAMYFCCRRATTSPFSAWTSGRAPSSAQRRNDWYISSSFTISAPL